MVLFNLLVLTAALSGNYNIKTGDKSNQALNQMNIKNSNNPTIRHPDTHRDLVKFLSV